VLNLGIAVFNMIPIPPLDGHRVLGYFLPSGLRAKYYEYGRWGMFLLLILLATGALATIVGPVMLGVGRMWDTLMPPGLSLFEYTPR
jgi:Zn-dependent protease